MDNLWYLIGVGLSIWLNLKFLRQQKSSTKIVAVLLGVLFPLISTFVYWLRRPRDTQSQRVESSLRQTPRREPAISQVKIPDDGFLCPGTGYFNTEVVGESRYLAAIRKAVGGSGQTEVFAELKREPQNKFDTNAVVVLISNSTVGYLPREEAPRYHNLIDQLAAARKRSFAKAEVYYSSESGDQIGSVRLDICEPEFALAINYSTIPAGARHWPTGRMIQLSDEAKNMGAIAKMISSAPFGAPFAAYFSLRFDETNSAKQLVEVCYSGERVGLLSAATGKKFAHAISRAKELSREFYVRGEVTGNSLAVEIRLDAKSPEELTEEEVKSLFA